MPCACATSAEASKLATIVPRKSGQFLMSALRPRQTACYHASRLDFEPSIGRLTSSLVLILNPAGDSDLPSRRHAQESRPVHQGRSMSSYTSISSEKLFRLIGTAKAPALIDVRPDDDFAADPRLIPGASRQSHRHVGEWSASFRS